MKETYDDIQSSILAIGPGGRSWPGSNPGPAQPPEATASWISFPTGSTELHQQDLDTIKSVANYMKQYPDMMATIEGKADTVGTTEFNDRLSEKRTIAVFDTLVYVNGIPASRTHMHWTGERLPNVPTADQAAERQSCRTGSS